MSWRSHIIIVISCLKIILVSYTLGYADIANRVVAIVNDDIITLYELNSKIKEITGRDVDELRRADERGFMDVRRRVLDFLVDDKITQQKVAEIGITITPAEVDAALERVKRNNNMTQEDLLAQLKNQGKTLESYRQTVKSELERIQLINFEVKSRIIIREESLRKYYDENQDQFVTHETVHLAAIVLQSPNPPSGQAADALKQRAGELSRRIEAGENFGDLARKYSQGPGADQGGDLGTFKTTQLNPVLLEAIEGLKPGDITPPIASPAGIQIVKLIDRQSGTAKEFEEVKDAIQNILYREEIDRRYQKWLQELRDKAYTKIIF